MGITNDIYWLAILSIVVASISWTVTQEEVFREPRDWAKEQSEKASNILVRKFFYVWTCEYCFSHWVTLAAILLTGFTLLFDDWRGYVLAFFALPWTANQLMSLYRSLRIDIKHEDLKAEVVKHEKEEKEREAED